LLDHTIYQEVPKFSSQQNLRGLVDKTTAQQLKSRQFETDLELEIFLLKFLNLIIQQEIQRLKLFSKQEIRNVVDKTTQGTAIRVRWAQDLQAAAETSNSKHHSYDGEGRREIGVGKEKNGEVRRKEMGVQRKKKKKKKNKTNLLYILSFLAGNFDETMCNPFQHNI
jgi:hypothetical protein